MSFHPPGRDYDEGLLDAAPKPTRAEKQEGYNLYLLAGISDTPFKTRPATATVDGHTDLGAGLPATKETRDLSRSIPWYRQKKWRIVMLVVGIIATGTIVGGAVGTLASSNNNSRPSSLPIASTSSGARSKSSASAHSVMPSTVLTAPSPITSPTPFLIPSFIRPPISSPTPPPITSPITSPISSPISLVPDGFTHIMNTKPTVLST